MHCSRDFFNFKRAPDVSFFSVKYVELLLLKLARVKGICLLFGDGKTDAMLDRRGREAKSVYFVSLRLVRQQSFFGIKSKIKLQNALLVSHPSL